MAKQISTGVGCLIIMGACAVIGVGALAFLSRGAKTAGAPTTTEHTLSANTSGTHVVVAVSRQALDELVRQKTDRAISAMVLAGKAFLVPQGTRVSILDRATGARKILVLEGPTMGRDGWVPAEWVK